VEPTTNVKPMTLAYDAAIVAVTVRGIKVAAEATDDGTKASLRRSCPRFFQAAFLAIEQERRVVNESPGEILHPDQASILGLLLRSLQFPLQTRQFAVEAAIVGH
jgi:hypothetical protein